MRLADFINANHERIVEAWQQFVERLPPFKGQASAAELHAHAGRLLDAVADDMRSPPQASNEAVPAARKNSAASGGSEHGLQRHAEGLSLVAMTSEFRALRAVVLRLWAGAGFVRSPQAFDDLVMFNESLDRVTAEAVLAFAQAAERDRALVMGIVAHDLRGPLHTASMTSHILAHRHPQVREDEALGQLRRSLARMVPMVDDLMGVAAASLHSRMAVRPVDMDLALLAAEIVSEVNAEFPAHRFVLEAQGQCFGHWDRARLGQLISNLLRNAAIHGDSQGAIRVVLAKDPRRVVLSVHNRGPVIAQAELSSLFSPTARGSNAKPGAHLGLGLFIVQEIARGHGGRVDVVSDVVQGTVFSVHLPIAPGQGADNAADADQPRGAADSFNAAAP